MDYERHYVAAFPVGNDGYWIEEKRRIDFPSNMSFGYEQLRFVIPTEVVIRDLRPIVPTIGRAWDTNLMWHDRKLVTHDEAFADVLKVANIEEREATSMSERTDEYYEWRDRISTVYQAIHAKLWQDALWAVEMFSACGDDGHVEYRFVGYALVKKDDVTAFIHQRFGRYGSEVTFV